MTRHEVSAYTVYPTGYDECTFGDKSTWTLTVENGGSEYGWSVRRGGFCLSRDGEWVWEHIPSERTDEWLAAHRFPEAEALERAAAVVDTLVINGVTIHQADAEVAARLARHAAGEAL